MTTVARDGRREGRGRWTGDKGRTRAKKPVLHGLWEVLSERLSLSDDKSHTER